MGRFHRTGIYDDRYAFRTPGLLNVEVTAPYGHSGVFADLESIIRHHLDPELSLKNYNFSAQDTVQQGMYRAHSESFSYKALENLNRSMKQGRSKLRKIVLSDSQIDDLVEFLHALTDPCVMDKECMSPWVMDN